MYSVTNGDYLGMIRGYKRFRDRRLEKQLEMKPEKDMETAVSRKSTGGCI